MCVWRCSLCYSLLSSVTSLHLLCTIHSLSLSSCFQLPQGKQAHTRPPLQPSINSPTCIDLSLSSLWVHSSSATSSYIITHMIPTSLSLHSPQREFPQLSVNASFILYLITWTSPPLVVQQVCSMIWPGTSLLSLLSQVRCFRLASAVRWTSLLSRDPENGYHSFDTATSQCFILSEPS